MKELIERLCNSVYSTIDLFIADIDLCISISLNIHVEKLPTSLDELEASANAMDVDDQVFTFLSFLLSFLTF